MSDRRHDWWEREERSPHPPTHVVVYAPLVRVRLALMPWADSDAAVATAVASWRRALHGRDDAGAPTPAEWWGQDLLDEGAVVDVEHVGATWLAEAIPSAPSPPAGNAGSERAPAG